MSNEDIQSVYSVEDRVFENPMYLMQYSLIAPEQYVGKAMSVENSAFITAKNEVYLRKVQSTVIMSLCNTAVGLGKS